MHTIDMLEQVLKVAEELGYVVRLEWLGGAGGGICEFSGRRWLFVDLALNAIEQLDQVTDALRADPAIHCASLPAPVREHFELRPVA